PATSAGVVVSGSWNSLGHVRRRLRDASSHSAGVPTKARVPPPAPAQFCANRLVRREKGRLRRKKNRTGPSAPVRPPPAPPGLRPRHARTRCVDSTARDRKSVV